MFWKFKKASSVDNVVDKQGGGVDNSERIHLKLTSLVLLANNAKLINLHHQRIRATQSGGYLSPYKGHGMEFEEVRLYQNGDDVRSIDWKVTARTGKVHTKIFREERERPVFISINDCKTMQFATRGVFKSVQAKKLAALIAWSAHFHGDKVGGQIFTENTCQEIKPKNSQKSLLQFLNTLITRPQNAQEISFDHVILRLQRHIHPGSLIYLIGDFRSLSSTTEAYMAKLSRHCRLVLILISDPLEKSLPNDSLYKFTNGQNHVIIGKNDSKKNNAYEKRFQKREAHLRTLAQKMNFLLITCSTTDNPVDVLR